MIDLHFGGSDFPTQTMDNINIVSDHLGFRKIIACAQQLSNGLQPMPCGLLLSRGSLALMFSRKLPMDVCW